MSEHAVFHEGVQVGAVRIDGDIIIAVADSGIAFGDDFDTTFEAVRAVLHLHIWQDGRTKWRNPASLFPAHWVLS